MNACETLLEVCYRICQLNDQLIFLFDLVKMSLGGLLRLIKLVILPKNHQLKVINLVQNRLLRVKLAAIFFKPGNLLSEASVLISQLLDFGRLIRLVVLSESLFL